MPFFVLLPLHSCHLSRPAMEMSSRGCSALRPFACIRWKQARQKKPYTNGHENFKQVKSIRVSLHCKKIAICKALVSHQQLEELVTELEVSPLARNKSACGQRALTCRTVIDRFFTTFLQALCTTWQHNLAAFQIEVSTAEMKVSKNFGQWRYCA